MAVIAWKKIYETGIVTLDNEHKALVSEVNNLYEAIREKRGDQIIGDILIMLEKYTVDHFQHEEGLLEEYGYLELDEHKKIHADLIDSVQAMKQGATSGTDDLAKELLTFMRRWVLDHIVEVDKKYGPFIESRAGRFVE